jgi:hypothetical protein
VAGVSSTARMSEVAVFHGQMHLSPLATPLNAVLTYELDQNVIPVLSTSRFKGSSARRYEIWTACPRQAYAALRAPRSWLDLPAAQRRVNRNGPVQARHLQQAGNHPCRLPQAQFEKDLDRQAELDRGIRDHRRAASAPAQRCAPDHLLVQPDQQRPPLPQQCSWTSSWCGSGRVMAWSFSASNGMHSQCESSTGGFLQQCLEKGIFQRLAKISPRHESLWPTVCLYACLTA